MDRRISAPNVRPCGRQRFLGLILDAAFGFRDAERAVAELSKRFFGARCALATSIAARNDNKKIFLRRAAQICVALLIGLPAREARHAGGAACGRKALQDFIISDINGVLRFKRCRESIR
jgi:hypothetical protein